MHPTRPWYRRAVETRTTAVGDFQISPVTRMPDMIVAHPLVSRTGTAVIAALRVAERGDVTGPVVAILADSWDRYFAQPWVKGERPA